MHELSIAHQLVTAAEEAARQANAVSVRHIKLRLGTMAGVVKESLEFCWDLATEGTVLAGSRLLIEDVAAAAECGPCGREVELTSPQLLRCPHCNTPARALTRGRELDLVEMDYTAGDAAASAAS